MWRYVAEHLCRQTAPLPIATAPVVPSPLIHLSERATPPRTIQEPVAAASRVFVKSAALWCDFHENLSRDVQWHNGEERTKLWFPSTESPGNRCVSEHITPQPRAKPPGLSVVCRRVVSSKKG
eukprot:m.202611 g.202611  ORF g.202611 m.202611 type:complete len:123 (+) comp25249_c2_seq6:260-628(+)